MVQMEQSGLISFILKPVFNIHQLYNLGKLFSTIEMNVYLIGLLKRVNELVLSTGLENLMRNLHLSLPMIC
jgi:hypothetical protein